MFWPGWLLPQLIARRDPSSSITENTKVLIWAKSIGTLARQH